MADHDRFQLAELNIARLRQPLDAEESREFTAALEPINLLAEVSDGFVWRLVDESGQSSSFVKAFDDPLEVVNLSVWESVETLRHFAYKSGHVSYFRRKGEWFELSGDRIDFVCWWIPAGTIPTVDEAIERLEHLRANGPSAHAFALANPFPPAP